MKIELTDQRDIAFAAMAQGALVNNTQFPSGWFSPAKNMIIRGTALVPPTAKDKYNFDLR